MKKVLSVAFLSLFTAAACQASTLTQLARFQKLHGLRTSSADLPSVLIAGMHVSGEHILLENGHLSVKIQKVTLNDTTAEGVGAEAGVPLDDGFFADPMKAVVGDFLAGATATVDKIITKAQIVDQYIEDHTLMNVEIKNVKVTHNQGAFTFSAGILFLGVEANGHAAFNAATKELAYTIEDIKAGGFPVCNDLAFFLMSHFLNYDFIRLDKPNVIIRISAFMPGSIPGQTQPGH